MTVFRAAIFAALLLCWGVQPGKAQDVTLTSPDGAVEITGTLLGFDGEFYRVDTRFGELTVDGSGVLCDGPACPSLTDYVAEVAFSGSSTMAEVLLPALIEGFAIRSGLTARRETLDDAHFQYNLINPNLGTVQGRFRFRASSTDEGFADLLANETDVVMALREIRPEERQRANAAGMGDLTDRNRSRVLALDAMVPVVAADNPVHRISLPDLAAVLSGEIGNWADLGGPDAPISVHMPAEGSGLAQAAEDRLLRPGGLSLTEAALRHTRNSALVEAVSRDPFGIGLASYSELGVTRALTLTGSCGYALSASRRSIKTEDYPLTSPMFLYLPARRLPKLARSFLNYTRSPAAQIVIRRSGLVDQTPEQISINMQGHRFANAIRTAGPEVELAELQRMVNLLEPMARMTTSFRFEAGSARPDAQSRANITQLAQALEAGTYDTKQLVLVGFSDGEGPASGNKKIALARARAVRDAVLKAAETIDPERVLIEVAAFGEALPMACDDSAWGRQVNRRVEVWVR